MREKAIVVASKKQDAQVEIRRTSVCDGCRGCSVGKEGKPLRVWAKNPINAKVGQVVEIELRAKTFLSATLIAYGLPLLAFLIGVGAMFTCFLCIHLFTKREEINKKYSSRIVRVYEH